MCLCSHTYKGLLEWYRTESPIKEEEAAVWVNVEEACHIDVVRQGG